MKNKDKTVNLTNEELFRLYVDKGDISHFGELYHRFIPKVYGVCLKYLGNQEEAKDAVMDIYSTLGAKVRQYEIQNFNSWLYMVVKNHCMQVLKKGNRLKFVNFDDAGVENSPIFTHTDKPASDLEEEALSFCMNTLSEEQKKSVELFYIDSCSYADIVDLTGYALSKVKSYIQNGKRNLKTCILNFMRINS